MNNLVKSLNANGGTFVAERYIIVNSGVYPSSHISYIEEGQNLDSLLDRSKFESILNIPLDFLFCSSYHNTYSTSYSALKKNEKSYVGTIVVGNDTLVIEINTNKISISYVPTMYSYREILKFEDLLRKNIPLKEETNKNAKVQLVTFQNYYDTIESEIKATTVDIKKNYNDDFLPIYDKLVDFIHQRESGLVLLSGLCGTGKTTLVKNLITHEPQDYLFITPSVASNMGNPNFVSFLMENKNSIFILEDCEQLLQERTTNTWSTSLANILNMTDGMLSDIFNIKFICTFNAPETTIDPALLREGRCFVNYKFDKLKADKVVILNKENNLGIPDNEICDMTLAELYNYQGKKETKKKIGF